MTVKYKRDVIKIPADATGDKRFFCSDGCISKNLADLSVCLTHMSQDNFDHHVDATKNDFSNWIRDVLGDKQLAEDLSETKEPAEAFKVISERTSRLRKKQG